MTYSIENYENLNNNINRLNTIKKSVLIALLRK